MIKIDKNLGNYKQSFDKMYELKYDLCWLDKEIPSEIKGYIQTLTSNKLLDTKTSTVLDLGCGKRQFLYHLEQEGFNRTMGVDVLDIACQS